MPIRTESLSLYGLLWFYLWEDPENSYNNAEKISQFFDSFQIEDRDFAKYKNWVGKAGAVYVSHYDGMKYDLQGPWYKYEANKDNLSIWENEKGVSRAIAFMIEIGLISIESDRYQFGAYYEKDNKSKYYRYYKKIFKTGAPFLTNAMNSFFAAVHTIF